MKRKNVIRLCLGACLALTAVLLLLSAKHYRNPMKDVLSDQGFWKQGDTLPDLPLLIFSTDSGEDPRFQLAVKPSDNLAGASITGNEYEQGSLTVMSGGKTESYAHVKIKVRGNTSALAASDRADPAVKLPYKLKFDNPTVLPGMGSEYALREWVLLKGGTSLNTWFGCLLSSLVGMEWTLPMEYVNVVLNGDWKGCYILIPSVEKESSHGLIGKDGYLFEDDPYWWKEDKPCFRLDNQNPSLAYTVKYPEIRQENDGRLLWLQTYMEEFETLLASGDEKYADYIDTDSFARWLLAQDISGNQDSWGSNLFFYKAGTGKDSKVKMGPLWDFDAVLRNENQWSTIHSDMSFCLARLFWTDPFFGTYKTLWSAVSPTLLQSVSDALEELDRSSGEALRQSWVLDRRRWGKNNYEDFTVQKERILSYVEGRIPWIENAIQLKHPDSSLLNAAEYSPVYGMMFFFTDTEYRLNNRCLLRGWAVCSEGSEGLKIGLMSGSTVLLSEPVSRPDVQSAFSADTDLLGFIFEFEEEESVQLCMVDTERKILYFP